MQPVVVFELNEVPWRVIDWWAADHPDSAIARLLPRAGQWTSVTPDEGHLSPWITWPTVHRGVPNTVHHIGHFGQDVTAADVTCPPWWQIAVDGGRSVGVFGLLHTNELPSDVDRYAFYVPDTFAPTPATHPAELEPFQAFNLAMARASARNVDTGIDRATATAFLTRAPRLGLRPSTVARLVRQLADERRRPETRVRRRSYQSVLAFDLFLSQLRTATPDAAAFFTNHVASAMHRYWAATFPGDYRPEEFGFDDAWIATWEGELAEAMGHADRMVHRLVRYCDTTGTTLVVASSMGQQAAQGTPVRRQLYLRDLDRLAAAAGLASHQIERRPAMDPHVSGIVTPEGRDDFGRFVADLRIGAAPVVHEIADEGFFSLEFGQADDAIGAITIGDRSFEPAELGLEIVDIEDEVASTGYHIPEGTLMVFDPATGPGPQARDTVPTTVIAPFLLDLLRLSPAPHHVESGARLRGDAPVRSVR